MTTKKRKLNRGLDALLGTELTKQKGGESAPLSSSSPADGELRQIRLERLQRGKYQPRVEFDDTALNELAEGIKVQGVTRCQAERSRRLPRGRPRHRRCPHSRLRSGPKDHHCPPLKRSWWTYFLRPPGVTSRVWHVQPAVP